MMDILNIEIVKSFLNYLQSPEIQTILWMAKIVLGAFGILLFCVIIFCIARSGYLKFAFFQDWFEFLTFRPYGQRKITKRWQDISKRLERASESEYKLAVIEAESIFDEVLIKMGLSGQSFGERLEKISKDQLPSLDEVLGAHKIRNNIVHDPDYRLTLDQAKEAIEIYEKVLRELEVF